MKKLPAIHTLLICIMLTASGCAEKTSLLSRLQVAESAINRAEAAGATEADCPDLQLARTKAQQAREAMDQQQYNRARHLAEQALIDAHMAEIEARTTGTQKAAAELRKEIRLLQEQTEGSSR